MKSFARLLENDMYGQIVVILFDAPEDNDTYMELTFFDEVINRYDLRFKDRDETIDFFHNVDENSFKIVETKNIRPMSYKGNVGNVADDKKDRKTFQ